MTKKSAYLIAAAFGVFVLYVSGPRPAKPVYNTTFPRVPANAPDLEQFVLANENKHRLKPGNEARIVWHDSTKTKTRYSVVYLHGFSASHEEGNPVHVDFARTFGCNLFLARLSDHGIDTTEQLLLFTPDRLWHSGKEALAIGEAIGEEVILVSTSTGGTLALMLAAAYPEKVHALINMSPNIEINNSLAFMANNPWGSQIGRFVLGGKYQVISYPEVRQQFWNGKYRIEAIGQLQELLETAMTTETFQRITCPTLTLYFYKNEKEQDPTVRVSAMLRMHAALGTPADRKWERPIPAAGGHVIGSSLVAKDIAGVNAAAKEFAVSVLNMTPR